MPRDPDPRDVCSGHYPYGTFTPSEHPDVEASVVNAAKTLAEIAKFVDTQMRTSGLTQATLAARAGVSQAAVSDLLSGSSWSSGAVIAKVVAALNGRLSLSAGFPPPQGRSGPRPT